ncbi:tumor necrosis factor receptor superfamily member 14-like [Gadus chalcogrammus]|uniref:tumor necrosis factor receptor superfamily member 14-like n=1 Tax=Gadus chalcogrammus TaxID=1042646 RepID=UPI0024C27AD6|nr:tumor necrosis factor receptor superfamily member 14-like [Gadus chalcogrammus]
MIQTGINIGHLRPIFSEHLVWLIFIAITNVSVGCPSDEYPIMHHECCPNCQTGQYVSEDCTLSKYTVCLPCSEGTFSNGSNGLKQCFPCTDCASGLGFKLKKQCTTTSDALCEVLDGYFCKDSVRGGCMAVQRHKDCSPGQYISQRGTASQDTVCLNCNHGTFSNGNSTYCRPHKICEHLGLEQLKPGSDSKDSECSSFKGGDKSVWEVLGLIVLGTLIQVVAIFVLMLCLCIYIHCLPHVEGLNASKLSILCEEVE